MRMRRIFVFSGLYGLFLGMGLSTNQVTFETVIKGFLVTFPPIALINFFRDTHYHRKQNLVLREMREAHAIAARITKQCKAIAANESELYLQLIAAKEELIETRRELIRLQLILEEAPVVESEYDIRLQNGSVEVRNPFRKN